MHVKMSVVERVNAHVRPTSPSYVADGPTIEKHRIVRTGAIVML